MTHARFAVTGANGYIGERLLRRLGAGHVALSRRRPSAEAEWIAYDLALPAPALPENVGAFIHLAADLGDVLGQDAEQTAVRALMAQSRTIGARFVFVSSQSAKNPVSTYGRRKAAIEKIVLDGGGTVVRPGFVYGGRRKPGRRDMLAMLAGLPAMPDFGRGLTVAPVHIDVLSDALIAIGRGAAPKGAIVELAQPAVSISSYVASLRAAIGMQEQLRIPAPRIVLMPLAALSPNGLPGSVRQMLALAPLEDNATELGLAHPDLAIALAPSVDPCRRALAIEARALLRNVAGGDASATMARNYVRAVEASSDPRPLDARLRKRAHFASLGADDPEAVRFNQRLMLAATLFEFSQKGADRLIRLRRSGWFSTVARLGFATMAEAARIGGLRWKPRRPTP